MKVIGLVALLVLVALVEVTIAPLFPVSGAVPDFALITLAVIATCSGPRAVMVAVPLTAIFLGFAADRSPALLLLGYLPLLPLAALLEDSPVPLNAFARTLVAATATGIWCRAVLVLAAVVQSADVSAGPLIFNVLVPGLVLDVALLAVAYLPVRLLGWSGQRMTLQRGGF